MRTADLLAGLAAMLLIAAMVPRSLRAIRVLALAAGLAALGWLVLTGASAVWLALGAAFVVVCAVQLAIILRRSVSGEMLPANASCSRRSCGSRSRRSSAACAV